MDKLSPERVRENGTGGEGQWHPEVEMNWRTRVSIKDMLLKIATDVIPLATPLAVIHLTNNQPTIAVPEA